jgi:hypothetical protein
LPSLPSPISHNFTEAIAYLQSQGLTMLKSYWVNTSSVDADALTKDLRVAIRDQLANISADESFSFLLLIIIGNVKVLGRIYVRKGEKGKERHFLEVEYTISRKEK